MSVTVVPLVAALAVWMLACAWCGYTGRWLRFLAILVCGLSLNTGWMMIALEARPFGASAILAHVSALLYGISGFGSGWLAARFARQLRDTRVDQNGV